MSKGAYIGVDGVARKVKKMYIGVDGVARKVKKGYIGVNGIARLFYSSGSGVFVTRPAAAMTSNDSQGCIASASSTYSGYPAYKAFDKSIETRNSWAAQNGVLSAWIQLQMDVALENIIVTITNRDSDWIDDPDTGTIQGSNDGESWVDLCTFEGRDNATSGHSTVHECNNSTAYCYVRINVSRTNGGEGYVAVGDISIMGELPETD